MIICIHIHFHIYLPTNNNTALAYSNIIFTFHATAKTNMHLINWILEWFFSDHSN